MSAYRTAGRLTPWVGLGHALRWLLQFVLAGFSRTTVAVLFCAAMLASSASARAESEAGISVKGEKDFETTEESQVQLDSTRRARGVCAASPRERRHLRAPRAIEPCKADAPRARWQAPRRTGSDDEDDETT